MNESETKVSCIVPVYNEGARVGGVLSALVGHPDLDEVIVVNDGSSDASEEILKSFSGIKLISYKPNRGKSHAVLTGFKAARNNLVMMIDSDLLGLDKEAISALLAPVRTGRADMSMSLRKNSLGIYKLFKMDFFSGERVFDKRIIPHLEDLDKLPGFGLESYLNRILIQNKLRLAVVYLDKVITPRKSVKFGFWVGAMGDYRMVRDIAHYLTVGGATSMFLGMLRRKI